MDAKSASCVFERIVERPITGFHSFGIFEVFWGVKDGGKEMFMVFEVKLGVLIVEG